MSIDHADFAAVTQQAQQGSLQSFWPIAIATLATMQLRTEYEINIQPCDSIWMPVCYDLSIARNIAQAPTKTSGQWEFSPTPGPSAPVDSSGVPLPDIGYNVTDVYNPTSKTWSQLAPVFSIRVNTTGNPWLPFGLSTLMGQPMAGSGISNTPAQGGAMRSITGPISRLWVKFYEWGQCGGSLPVPGNFPGQQNLVVLMSSLGFAQTTYETVSNGVASGLQVVSSGGYFTPQLNSANKKYLGMA
jgi:hypothetical protein